MDFKKINLIIIVLLLTFSFSINYVKAGTFEEIKNGLVNTGKAGGYPIQDTGEPKKELADTAINFINRLLEFIGLIFMILILYGGFLWLTAQGNEEQVKKAKSLIVQATIALGVILASRLIVEVIINILGETVIILSPDVD